MLNSVFAIAITSYREAIRSKVLYSVLFFVILLICATSIFGQATIGDFNKVVKDFGLMSISFFSVIFCIITGATMLFKDLSKKTIYTIISRPIKRWEFIAGKFIGLLMTVSVLLILMIVLFEAYLFLLQGSFDWSLLIAFYFVWLELIVISATTIFFSSIFVTPTVNGLCTFGVFLAGRSAESILQFSTMSQNKLVSAIYWFIPNLEKLTVSNEIVYGELPNISYSFSSLGYAIGYSSILLILASFFFNRRQFN